ncbi:MAG: hypothetical protein JF592_10245 [Microbacterium sp.]|uniref:hypothetical protein n=1 Tax=Microbacterium sp. TaxID=51671 RepID=UPI001D732554|nr:hypothetical protein [Microbacterium sp.]MBW8762951.1 hypothetical protein [Microbacterium sp.]
MTISLVGFVAELTGSEDHLLEAQPVVEIDGDTFVAPGLDWTRDNLVPYQPSPQASFHRTPWRAEINIGDTIWVAGRTFVDRIKDCNAVGELAYEFGGWQAVALGFRASFGHREAFAELVRALRNNLERGLNQALFDHMNLIRGDAPVLHELYAALPLQPDLEYQLTRALCFDGERDEYSLDFIRAETVHLLELVESEEEFEVQLESKRQRLHATRVGERALGTPLPATPAPSHQRAVEIRDTVYDALFSHGSAPSNDLFLLPHGYSKMKMKVLFERNEKVS